MGVVEKVVMMVVVPSSLETWCFFSFFSPANPRKEPDDRKVFERHDVDEMLRTGRSVECGWPQGSGRKISHKFWWSIIKFTPYEWNMAQNKSEWETQFSMAPFGDFLRIPSSLRIHDLVPLALSITRWDLANASTRVIDRTSILTKKMTKALFQKRWTQHLEMLKWFKEPAKTDVSTYSDSSVFVGWYFCGIMYPPWNKSISHQTGIRKIIFKHTWVTGDVWVPWRIYTYIYCIYIYIYTYIHISILKKISSKRVPQHGGVTHGPVSSPRQDLWFARGQGHIVSQGSFYGKGGAAPQKTWEGEGVGYLGVWGEI